MKKIILLAIPALALSACFNTADATNQNIICPTGAPAFAFYKEAKNPNFETNSAPANIVAMMNENSDKNFVVIDTVSGVQAISKGAPYKIAASLTFGNFFIASTGHDTDGSMDAGDKVVLFGQNTTPDIVFHYIYGNTYDSGIEYVGNVQDAAKCLISSKNLITGSNIDYVFIAQPVLLNALAKNPNAAKYADIQEAYRTKSEGKSLIQASLFIKNTTDKAVANAFLNSLKENIEDALEDPTIVKSEISEALTEEESTSLYGVNPDLAVAALQDNNGLGLGFKKAKDIKADIDAFLKEVQGKDETSKDIYY